MNKVKKWPLANRLFFVVYDYLFLPLALSLTFSIGLIFSAKIRQGFLLRRKNRIPLAAEGALWVHASSGEFEYAKPIITEVKKTAPETRIIVTYFSPSYAAAIAHFPGVDWALPLPLDTPAATQSFVRKLKPKMLLVARTDLWPQILKTARQANIPTLLFSTTFRPITGIRRVLRFFYKILFNMIDQIFVVTEDDLLNVQSSGTNTKVEVTGDSRFDQVLYRINHPKPIRHQLFATKSDGSPILIAGSTWPEDEQALLPALADFIKQNLIRLIIAPHEPTPTHLASVESRLTQLGITSQRYTQIEEWTSPVLLIDQIGILAEIYTVGNLAFVGGSFKSKVHSVMEPLAAGLITFVGPFYKNNREAQDFNRLFLGESHRPMVTVVRNSQDLKNQISDLLAQLPNNYSKQIQDQVMNRSGATRHILSWVKSQS